MVTNCGYSMPSDGAEHPPWEVISMNATAVKRSIFGTIRVAIGIVHSAKTQTKSGGSWLVASS